MKRLLVTGSRTWPDESIVAYEMGRAIHALTIDGSDLVVVHGGASGVDSMAEALARSYWIKTEVHYAEWRPYGIYNPQAGHQRNQRMVDAGADLCLAFIFNNSPGATDCVRRAVDAGIPTRIFRESSKG